MTQQMDALVTPVGVVKYVLMVAGFLMLAMVILAIVLSFFDFDPGSGISTPILIAAIVFAVGRFVNNEDRAMQSGERFRFSLGIGLVSIILPVLYFTGALLFLGLPLQLSSVDVLMGGVSGTVTLGFLQIALLVGFLLSLVTSYLFAWIFGRQLVKAKRKQRV